MSAQSAVDRGRRSRARLGLWSSTAILHRKTGTTEQNEQTGAEVDAYETFPDIPFRLAGSEQYRTLGPDGAEREVSVRKGHFPVGTDVRDGDLVEMTSGENAGLWWSVVDASPRDQGTALRVSLLAADPLEG